VLDEGPETRSFRLFLFLLLAQGILISLLESGITCSGEREPARIYLALRVSRREGWFPVLSGG